MSYSLWWRSPSLPFAQKQIPIAVPSGSVVSNFSSLRFTGKGAANYGKIQQENLMRLLESFAGPTAPDYPTVGQTWFDTAENVLKVCVATAPSPVTWRAMHATQIGDTPPTPAVLGDSWFQSTGVQSGIQYTYTGVGRYPEQNWDAVAMTYFPVASTTMTALMNHSDFSTTNYSELYICAVSGSPSDTDGTIQVNGTVTTVPRGVCAMSYPVTNGFLVWDTTATMTAPSAGSPHFFAVRQLIDGSFQYDNNVSWVSFTPVSGMYAVGQVTNAEQDDNTAPGITAATIWTSTMDLTSVVQVPLTQTAGAIGGWEQTFPQTDFVAGRLEYNYMLSLLAELIDDASAFGGAGSIGRSISYLTPFNTLDASLRSAWLAGAPHDPNVVFDVQHLGNLYAEPNSQDWDKLLAACRYAVTRLELPSSLIDDISDLPFICDGRAVSPVVLALSGVQYPSSRRLTNPRVGSVTMSRMYQETVNALSAAISNRYILKGIQGASGVNSSFSSTVAVHQHTAFTANANGSSFGTTVTHGVQFNFDSTDVNLQRFFTAGQVLELIVQTQPSGSPTTADQNLASVCAQFGRFRVTQDAVYVMTNGSYSTATVTQVPGSIGFGALTTASQLLASATIGGATLNLRGNLVSTLNSGDATAVRLFIDIVAGGATTGSIFTTWNRITDDEVYNGSVRVFPDALTYAGADKLGNTAGLALFN